MNTIGIALVWCAVQVTLLGLLTMGLYAVVRRLRPAAAAPIVLSALMTVAILSVMALSPWPRWTVFCSVSPLQELVTDWQPSVDDIAEDGQELPENALDPLAREGRGEISSASGCLPDTRKGATLSGSSLFPKEQHRVRTDSKTPSSARFWQSLEEDLLQPQGTAGARLRRWPAVLAAVLLATMVAARPASGRQPAVGNGQHPAGRIGLPPHH